MTGFLKTTIIGGGIFLIPIIVLAALLGQAIRFTSQLAEPLAALAPLKTVSDIAIANVLALILVVLVCFLAGLAARAARASRFANALEEKALSKVPAYKFLKNQTIAMWHPEAIEGMKPVLAQFANSWRVAFEIERIDDDNVALFVPGSPNPWAGSVHFMSNKWISPLDLQTRDALKLLEDVGKGSRKMLAEQITKTGV